MQDYILLVDDDADDRQFFLDALKIVDSKRVCQTVNNGVECIDFLHAAAQLPAIIFSDINMPMMDGKELVKKLKDDPRYCHIPIAMLSTAPAGLEEDKFDKMGADYFIQKPHSFAPLISLIREVVQQGILYVHCMK